MQAIEDRLRDAGQVWREHVDSTAAPLSEQPAAGRRTPSRRLVLAAAAAGVLVVGGTAAAVAIHNASRPAGTSDGVSASCAAPQLRLVGAGRTEPPVVTAGSEVTLAGRYYVDGCNDTGQHTASQPLTVTLLLLRGDSVAQLGKVQAHGELGTFRTTVRIPTDFPAGKARVTGDVPQNPLIVIVTKQGQRSP